MSVRPGARRLTARSGPDGRYVLAPVLPGAWSFQADEPRFVLLRRNIEIAFGEAKKLDAPLVPGATLVGRVTDESGQPVNGAQGALAPATLTGIAALLRPARTGGAAPVFRTSADGTFRASRLAPSENQRLIVSHPEYAASTVGGINLLPGQTSASLAVVLQRGAVIAGVVRDQDGNPLEGAEADVQQGMDSAAAAAVRRSRSDFSRARPGRADVPVKTGADGRFDVRGLPPGDYSLWVGRADMPPNGSTPSRCRRGIAGTARRHARSRCGDHAASSGRGAACPAEGWSVLASEAGTSTLGPRARGNMNPTGPDGLFVLEGLKPGQPYDLQLYGGPGIGPSKKNVVPPADGVDVVVSGAGRIAGRAVDAQTGRPIPEYAVSYEPERAGGGGVFRIVNRMAGQRLTGMGEKTEVRSDDGTFQLDDVPPGTWSVVVEAKGYQTRARRKRRRRGGRDGPGHRGQDLSRRDAQGARSRREFRTAGTGGHGHARISRHRSRASRRDRQHLSRG